MGNPGLRKRQRGTMPKGEHLGEFEQHVLAAVWRLRGDAYGMNVRRYIAQRTGRDMAIGAVYATLDRLERKGFVSSRVGGEATPERGGRAEKYFDIEAPGVRALKAPEMARLSAERSQRLRAAARGAIDFDAAARRTGAWYHRPFDEKELSQHRDEQRIRATVAAVVERVTDAVIAEPLEDDQ